MDVKKYIILIVCILCVFLSVFTGAYTANMVAYITGGDDLEMEEIDEVSTIGLVNILVLGVDIDGTRTDTMMLFSINGIEKKVSVLSIPRDTYVSFGRYHEKINSAIGIGMQEVRKGNIKEPEDMTIKKVKELTGLPVHYFVTVNFKGFRNIIDILGGVDFDVPDVEGKGRGMNYEDPIQGLSIHLKPGMQRLNGKQAEGLVRYRYGYAEGDVGRIRLQQNFLKAMAEQKLTPQYFLKINELFEEVQANIKTNYTIVDLAKHAMLIKSISSENIHTYQLPGEPRYISDISYYIYDSKKTAELTQEHFMLNIAPTPSPEPSGE